MNNLDENFLATQLIKEREYKQGFKDGWKVKEKEKSDLYYAQEGLDHQLRTALEETRMEPGLSLKDIANIIKKVFAAEEIESLVRELK